MDDIKADIKDIKESVHRIDRTLAINTESLVHHVKRTDVAERRIERVESWMLGLLSAILVAILGILMRGFI